MLMALSPLLAAMLFAQAQPDSDSHGRGGRRQG